MEVQRRAVEAHLADEWRAVAVSLGHQPPLVTLRRTASGGGEATVWWADAEAAVTATLSRWSLPPLQHGADVGASLLLVAANVSAAASASWAAAAAAAGVDQPRTTLTGGQPAALTLAWTSYEQMVVAMQSVIPRVAGGRTAAAGGEGGFPSFAGGATAGGGRRTRAALALARAAEKGVRSLAQAKLTAVAEENQQRAQHVPADRSPADRLPADGQQSAPISEAEKIAQVDAQAAIDAMRKRSEMARAQQRIALNQKEMEMLHETAMRSIWGSSYNSPRWSAW